MTNDHHHHWASTPVPTLAPTLVTTHAQTHVMTHALIHVMNHVTPVMNHRMNDEMNEDPSPTMSHGTNNGGMATRPLHAFDWSQVGDPPSPILHPLSPFLYSQKRIT